MEEFNKNQNPEDIIRQMNEIDLTKSEKTTPEQPEPTELVPEQ
ncbi:MAG: hypothetical protein ACI9JY_002264, partial [Saprospiraceae bacterium]